MIDKSLVKKRFSKSFKTYNENAVVQKKMAEKLIQLLPRKNYGSILEIGCATGILTEQIAEKLVFSTFTANDIVENAHEYINKIIPKNIFISGDIEEIFLPQKYDLIISNASLQWCENTEKVVNRLKNTLNNNGVLAISIFSNDNYKEIKNILNLTNTLKTNLSGIEESYTLYFDNPIDVLRHIKATGANALAEFSFTKKTLKDFCEQYKKQYSDGNKVSLTYKPLYIVSNMQ